MTTHGLPGYPLIAGAVALPTVSIGHDDAVFKIGPDTREVVIDIKVAR